MSDASRAGFVHLHLHTEYSLLDGGNRITPLLEHVKSLGMDAVAVTDHGNLFGAMEFYSKAKKAGVKPILGIEAYVAIGDRTERKPTGIADGGFHLVLLAENNAGWANLLKLSSDSFLNGFYYKPRMDHSTLEQWSDGLIAINGHLGSSIAHHMLQFAQTGNDAHYIAAREEAIWHAETFGTNSEGDPCFYIELQSHSVKEQMLINPHLVRLARELDLPIVCDNDAHFMRAEDWDVHDSLCCISMGKIKDDTNRLHYPKELYVRSPEQMAELFHDLPEVVENTVRIAERCNVEIDFDANHAPVVKIVTDFGELAADPAAARAIVRDFECDAPQGSTEWFKAFCAKFTLEPFDAERDADSADDLTRDCDAALRLLAEAGAVWRYGVDGVNQGKRERLDRELRILGDKLISAYFLICWDFVNWARQHGIPANARGSGVGTMVGYVLGLSNACPVEYGLLFERFTDPDRAEYPDIDIDMCQDGRADVINYVRDRYGHVAQIITFGRLKAKAAIKDVSRVSGLSPSEGQRLANLIPNELNITLDAALEKEPDFRAEYTEKTGIRRVIDTARALEGHARHAGVHAAGVVVATQPLDNIVPLYKASGSDDIVTQWDGPTCEKVGLLKMDFLGLRTLSTIELARRHATETLDDEAVWRAVGRMPNDGGPHPLDLERLVYDDQKVLELFRRGSTVGIFQFESGGMRKLLIEMQPDRLADLIAANALFRPGPMDLIPEYCQRKHGRQQVPAIHPIVDALTAETYGIMVYQEQVMQIVHSLGGIPLRAAYTLIKAISKKKHDVIDSNREKFLDGAESKGLDRKQANDLFELILKFAGYGFNKSHSTGYAIIAYQTAYLKTYFPNQYMAAVLTYESGAKKVDDWVGYLDECRRTVFPDHTEESPHVGVRVEPPDINLSNIDFSVVFEDGETRDSVHGHVRFGLSAIKGVGRGVTDAIMIERSENGPFASLFDLCERVVASGVPKSTLESLIKSGALDSLHSTSARSAMIAALDDAVSAGQSLAQDRAAGQMNFFAALSEGPEETVPPAVRLPNVPAWDQMTTLSAEKDVLGFHVSGHPLDQYEHILSTFCTGTTRSPGELNHDAPILLGGLLSRVRMTVVKNGRSAGERMAMITIQDRSGAVDGVVFSTVFRECASRLEEGSPVLIVGRIDRERGEPQIIVDDVLRPDEAASKLAASIEVEFEDGDDVSSERQMNMLAGVIRQSTTRAAGARSVEVTIVLRTGDQLVTLRPSRLRAVPDAVLMQQIDELLGPGHVRITAAPPPVREDRRRSFRKRETVAV